MKLTKVIKNVEEKVVITLEIPFSEANVAIYSKKDREIMESVEKSNRVSAKLAGLKVVVRGIERYMQKHNIPVKYRETEVDLL